MTWHDRPMLGFDLETTGLDVETARIVSYALIHDGGPAGPIIRTGLARVEVPPEATAVHGITTAFAMTFGEDEATTVGRIVGQLTDAILRGVPIVGMNLAYDLTILDRRAQALGVTGLCRGAVGQCCPYPVFDVMVADKMVDRYRRGSRKLAALTEHYLGREHHDAHDAVADVTVSLQIARRIILSGWMNAAGPVVTHNRLAAARRTQQRGLRDYLVSAKLSDGTGFDECWPVCHHNAGTSPVRPAPLMADLELSPPIGWDDL